MLKPLTAAGLVLVGLTSLSLAQNSNSSTTSPEKPKTSKVKEAPPSTPNAKDAEKHAANAARTTANKPASNTAATPAPGSTEVVAEFNKLLDGIRKADISAVTGVYWNSPRLALFNNNGTVTKGWEQMRKNRESSYPDMKDVKLEVRDVSVIMLGRDGALVSCLWTQSQNYKGTPESASGRMTLVFRRTGKEWKAIHLHTSPDKEDPSRVMPSEQTSATPAPAPSPQ